MIIVSDSDVHLLGSENWLQVVDFKIKRERRQNGLKIEFMKLWDIKINFFMTEDITSCYKTISIPRQENWKLKKENVSILENSTTISSPIFRELVSICLRYNVLLYWVSVIGPVKLYKYINSIK